MIAENAQKVKINRENKHAIILDSLERRVYTAVMPKSLAKPKLRSNIPALIRQKGWTRTVFYGHSQIAGVSADTAKRAYRGEVNFKAGTLAIFAGVFGVKSIADVVDMAHD